MSSSLKTLTRENLYKQMFKKAWCVVRLVAEVKSIDYTKAFYEEHGNWLHVAACECLLMREAE